MKQQIDTIIKEHLEEIAVDAEMVEHDWKAMKTLIVAVPVTGSKGGNNFIPKKIFIAVAASLSALSVLYFTWRVFGGHNNAQTTIAIKKHSAPPLAPVTTVKITALDTLKISPVPVVRHKIAVIINPLPVNNIKLKPDSIKTIAPVMQLVPAPVVIRSNKEILDSFYSLLKTPTQHFVVNNTKDTVIVGHDSSEIMIPANCFVTEDGKIFTGNVTIQLDECYSYRDIIAHKLYTMSDSNMLESGGMLQIKATAQNKPLELLNGQALHLIMPAAKVDKAMQLFLPKQCRNCDSTSQINWVANYLWRGYKTIPKATLFNWKDDPFNIVTRHGKTIAKFRVYRHAKLPRIEIAAELKRRYPQYDEIRLRACNAIFGQKIVPELHIPFTHHADLVITNGTVIGDSIEVTPQEADLWKLWTAREKWLYYNKLKRDSAYWSTINAVENKYSFRIEGLGWINCDHFYNDPRPKVRYALNLKDTAANYVSQLIFLNCRLVMPAETYGNYISFPNVPVGEPVQLICIGVKNGKVMVSLQKFTVSKEMVNDVAFNETGADDMKKILKLSDIK